MSGASETNVRGSGLGCWLLPMLAGVGCAAGGIWLAAAGPGGVGWAGLTPAGKVVAVLLIVLGVAVVAVVGLLIMIAIKLRQLGRDEIAAYQRSRFGVGARSGMSCM